MAFLGAQQRVDLRAELSRIAREAVKTTSELQNVGQAETCTLKCVDGGAKFILADRAHKVVYALDDNAQERAREFAGQKVTVTGQVDTKAKTIRVSKIEAAG